MREHLKVNGTTYDLVATSPTYFLVHRHGHCLPHPPARTLKEAKALIDQLAARPGSGKRKKR